MIAKPTLSDRQQAFVREYLVDFCATAAARRAGYAATTAEHMAGRLLANVAIRCAIETAKQASGKAINVTKDWLIQETAQAFLQARADNNHAGAGRLGELLGKFHGWNTETRNIRNIRSASDLSREELLAIANTPLPEEGGTDEADGTRH